MVYQCRRTKEWIRTGDPNRDEKVEDAQKDPIHTKGLFGGV